MPIKKKSYFYILRHDQVVLAKEFCICICILFATHDMITIIQKDTNNVRRNSEDAY